MVRVLLLLGLSLALASCDALNGPPDPDEYPLLLALQDGGGGDDVSLYAVSLDGRQKRLTGSGFAAEDPDYRPDGRRIAFSSTIDAIGILRTLQTADAEGDRIRPVAPYGVEDPRFENAGTVGTRPKWAPDGRRIAYMQCYECSFADAPPNIAVANVETDEENVLTTLDHSDWAPSWSPDGTRIAFMSDRGQESNGLYIQFDVYTMRPDGVDVERTTDTGTNVPLAPAWHPDGSRIAYQFADYESGAPREVRVVDLNSGEHEVVYTHGDYSLIGLRWSSDGRSLLFARRSGSEGGIYALRLATGAVEQLFAANGQEIHGWDWHPLAPAP